MKRNKIYQGDALEVLKDFPSKSVNMAMTSPPYWALRDYGEEGQLGLEETPKEYVNKICDVFDEVKRILREDGTFWLNIGDSYNTNLDTTSYAGIDKHGSGGLRDKKKEYKGLEKKSLVGIPWRVALEMQRRGWIIRNDIIWHKPNAMPESVTDRFTVDYEHLFLFSKNKEYYFEQQFEPHKEDSYKRARYKFNKFNHDSKLEKGRFKRGEKSGDETKEIKLNPKGRNKRTTWEIPTKHFSEAHFAVYPEELCKTPIKAGCPKKVCSKCGKPVLKKYKTEPKGRTECNYTDGYGQSGLKWEGKGEVKTVVDSCDCDAEYDPGIVLDPFTGAGTTLLVAEKFARDWVGVELSQKYVEMAYKRIGKINKECYDYLPEEKRPSQKQLM